MLKGIVSLIQAQKDAYNRLSSFLVMLKRPKKTDVVKFALLWFW